MSDRTVVVLGKAPEPGKVKTRMVTGGLSPREAAALQLACLNDVLSRDYGPIGRHLWRKGIETAPIWKRALTLGWECSEQASDNLGMNLIDACAAALPGRVVLIGTDSPDLPSELFEAAWAALESVDLVLGPSFDGGYYLIGVRVLNASIFEEVEWGSESVFATTLRNATNAGLSVETLPFWYDLDEVADLQRLRLHSGLQRSSQVPYRAEHVLRFLSDLEPQF